MKKFVSLFILSIGLIGMTAAAQPRITELSDNFGNTYELEADKDDAMQYVYPEKDLTVTDDMEVTLCVDEVYAEEDDELLYSFDTNQDLERVEDTTDKCHTWETGKEDYQSYWQFEAKVRDKDGVKYVNDVDHVVQVRWRSEKLNLEGEADERTSESYDNVLLSESEYEELKDQGSSDSESSVSEGQKTVDEDDWEELQERPTSDEVTDLENEVNQKEEKISDLQEQVSELQNKVSELQSTIDQLNKTENPNQPGSPEDVAANGSNEKENLPGNQQAEENRPGFVNGLLESIFD